MDFYAWKVQDFLEIKISAPEDYENFQIIYKNSLELKFGRKVEDQIHIVGKIFSNRDILVQNLKKFDVPKRKVQNTNSAPEIIINSQKIFKNNFRLNFCREIQN